MEMPPISRKKGLRVQVLDKAHGMNLFTVRCRATKASRVHKLGARTTRAWSGFGVAAARRRTAIAPSPQHAQ
jgi:hypothetical protein